MSKFDEYVAARVVDYMSRPDSIRGSAHVLDEEGWVTAMVRLDPERETGRKAARAWWDDLPTRKAIIKQARLEADLLLFPMTFAFGLDFRPAKRLLAVGTRPYFYAQPIQSRPWKAVLDAALAQRGLVIATPNGGGVAGSGLRMVERAEALGLISGHTERNVAIAASTRHAHPVLLEAGK